MTSQDSALKFSVKIDDHYWLESQSKVLLGALSRIEVTELARTTHHDEGTVHQTLRIWRNFAIEPIESWIKAIGNYWNLDYELQFMGYDDSFSFLGVDNFDDQTIEVLFIDRDRYRMDPDEFNDWLSGVELRIGQLSKKQVICIVINDQINYRINSEPVGAVIDKGKQSIFDSRYEKTSGSRLTAIAYSAIARDLAGAWAPSIFAPPKKLLVVDLDFTLHDGILGELQNEVVVNNKFLSLQKELLVAKARGFLLAIISKNDLNDVLKLIETHPEYLLKEKDFVAIEASWDVKHEAMQRILQLTRIHHESVVFIDDNPVELLQMKSIFPSMSVVSAKEGPEVSVQTLQFVPGYRRAKTDGLADIRKGDLISNEARRSLIDNGLKSYYSAASPVLKVLVSNEHCLDRLVDLGKRSNQFNLLIRRMEKSSYQEDNAVFVGLGLIDRFSDSGVIGGMVVSRGPQETRCVVEEMFLSCRVLGRGLETALLCQGMLAAIDYLGVSDIEVSWIIAERNQPAIDWLGSCILSEVPTENGTVSISRQTVSSLSIPPEGVICEISK